MRRKSLLAIATLIAAPFVMAGCTISQPDGGEAEEPAGAETQAPGTAEGPIPVEPDGGIGDGAPPLEEMISQQETGGEDTPSGLAKSFPTALRGTWRSVEDGEVTAECCDGYDPANMGKVLTVRDGSYSYFETGGRFVRVKSRDAGSIRAEFDTTYADTPTRDELEFRVDPVARTLTVENFDTGEEGTTVYRRCPRQQSE
ncbi:hypothetical protein [Alteriqipengyuania lutimaris]|uniref:Lipocalin-like domain-containing protein n=1 Tax=Alteriqipengyuania lutimaris TaxID=1538146 RepID=A0A395LH81_9SPHN|nr:hypothetical protein [Alteriqipengyuania lutimaris]MBB3034904.1 hypothetical protein [Alteriqipengyuania lutimaris]RDS76266.1 hypothetical protein DL238_00640 [Alteriqipengyuania lutimaris]